jgi:glutamate---cysteine ligase / carboxylate-amine ligase
VISPASLARHAFDAASTVTLTVGVEEEFLLVDLTEDVLAPVAGEVIEVLYPDKAFRPELRAAQIETVTPVCGTVDDVGDHLIVSRSRLAEATSEVARVLAAPVFPGTAYPGPATGQRRYLDILLDAPWASRSLLACGMHVHAAVGDADRAVALHDRLRSYLPLLGAISANSPIYDGVDSGVASARAHLNQSVARFGSPPAFGSWNTFAAFVRWGAAGGVIADPSYHWYGLRLNPLHGTVEVRVFDLQTDVTRAAALTALTQSLAAWLLHHIDNGKRVRVHDHHRIQESLWLAARDGAQASLPDLDTGLLTPVETQLAHLIGNLRPHAEALGCAHHLDCLVGLQELPGHEQQRHVFSDGGLGHLIDWLTLKRQPTNGDFYVRRLRDLKPSVALVEAGRANGSSLGRPARSKACAHEVARADTLGLLGTAESPM